MKKSLLALVMVLCLLCTSGLAETLRSLPEDKTIEIDVLMGVNSNKPNNMVELALAERLNVKLNITYALSSAFDDKLNTTLASGQLPDIIFFLWKSMIPASWIEQEAVIRLDDPENNLLEKYGKNYLAMIDDSNRAWMTDYNGEIYSVKSMTQFGFSNTLAIRYDWLEKLDLEKPSTVEEFIEVMRAFKTKDPNGNGMADEIPMLSNGYFVQPFQHAYGLMTRVGSYCITEDNTLLPVYEMPQYKEYIDLMRSLYEEGLVDPELARDIPTRDELVGTDKVGITFCTGNETTKITKAIRANGVENAILGQIDPMIGPGGQNIPGRNPMGTSAAITTTAEDPEACMMVLDYLFSEEGQILTNYGIEGVSFDYVDGKPILREPYCLSWENARGVGIAMGTWTEVWNGDNFLQITFQGKQLEDLDEVDSLAYYGYYGNADFCYQNLPGFLTDTPTNREISADIWTPLSDAEKNYVMGIIEWEEFESLLKELKEYGMDKITEEVNANYDTLK